MCQCNQPTLQFPRQIQRKGRHIFFFEISVVSQLHLNETDRYQHLILSVEAVKKNTTNNSMNCQNWGVSEKKSYFLGTRVSGERKNKEKPEKSSERKKGAVKYLC